MRYLISRLHLNYGQKLFLIATLPLILTAVAISVVVTLQSRYVAAREIETLEAQLIAAKRAELRNYLSIARTAFINIYGRAAPDDDRAKLLVTQILAGMLYGQDGYFFVYDFEGTNLVSPRRTELIGRNWTGLEDPSGRPITDELIRLARSGGGYHSYEWPKPSTGERAQMVAYVAIDLRGHLNGASLRITDNGCGLDAAQARQGGGSGLGLRNMQERIDQLDGTLRVTSSKSGTEIEASVPLTHLLQPQGQPQPDTDRTAQA